MQEINGKLRFLGCLARYSVGFVILCIVNHFVSVVMFRQCGYCLVTYIFVYTFYLVTVSIFLSTIVYNLSVRKDEQTRLLAELRAVKYDDMPYVMVSLLERIRERQKAGKPQFDEHAKEASQDQCIACYEVLPSIRNVPCGHVVLCSGCNWQLIRVSIENQSPLVCSWCRTPVKDFEGQLRPNLDLLELQDIRDALSDLKMRKINENMKRHYRITY